LVDNLIDGLVRMKDSADDITGPIDLAISGNHGGRARKPSHRAVRKRVTGDLRGLAKAISVRAG
jgi:hypothetical protein